jgi:hypothetical protein
VPWGSLSFLFGPVMALVVVGALGLVLRWAFGPTPGQRRPAATEQQLSQQARDDFGLLVPVSSPPTMIEAELIRRRLLDHGLRATATLTSAGPRVLVFPADEQIALAVLRSDTPRTPGT